MPIRTEYHVIALSPSFSLGSSSRFSRKSCSLSLKSLVSHSAATLSTVRRTIQLRRGSSGDMATSVNDEQMRRYGCLPG
jgi:hypothetical protein